MPGQSLSHSMNRENVRTFPQNDFVFFRSPRLGPLLTSTLYPRELKESENGTHSLLEVGGNKPQYIILNKMHHFQFIVPFHGTTSYYFDSLNWIMSLVSGRCLLEHSKDVVFMMELRQPKP